MVVYCQVKAEKRMSSTRATGNLHTEIHDFLCLFHNVKKNIKEASPNPSSAAIGEEQRNEQLLKLLYKILNEIDHRISAMPGPSEPSPPEYFDDWTFLTWILLTIISRIESNQELNLLNFESSQCLEKMHAALIVLVNKAKPIEPPALLDITKDPYYGQFYESYVTTLHALHDLYTFSKASNHQCETVEYERHFSQLKSQLVNCLELHKLFCNTQRVYLWHAMRSSQIEKMTKYGFDNKGFMNSAMSFYSNMLYNLGVLAARLQGFRYETGTCQSRICKTDPIRNLLLSVFDVVDILLSDSTVCVEPSQNPILVTNNLFPMKIVSLCRSTFFKDFTIQIVSEEVAATIQQEMHRRKLDGTQSMGPTPSGALLAMKPSSGVKRNNATANADGGNTAHKKSDVSSKEWISISPSYDTDHLTWVGLYPHLLCTTRQKDAVLDSRSTGQTGKRPLFYFHVKAEIFSPIGNYSTTHTLSLPFAIATRRNQDCQVQRMMSSYTATCFWLYATNVVDGLMLQWCDTGMEWKHFKLLYAYYFAKNAEISRSLVDADFAILENKMFCAECSDAFPFGSRVNSIAFKNLLCPHLSYSIGKSDVRFSIWRGMLELLHLFSDQRTEVKTMWESGLLQGFMEPETVYSLLRNVDSALIMRLSFVIGCCVCITVKSEGEILDLEPLDLKRLQAKSLDEYLRDIIFAEKVEHILNADKSWMKSNEALKLCAHTTSKVDAQEYITTREVTSNMMHAGDVDKQTLTRFTALRVAVVTCKPRDSTNSNTMDMEASSNLIKGKTNPANFRPGFCSKNYNHNNDEEFLRKLSDLMTTYGKSSDDVFTILAKNAPSTVYQPIIEDFQKVSAQP
uniref:Uncharacterized protein n=1 Tax=Acrobeloides nanus TaxID=290746 RepID=A0A914BW93_9BILA